MKDVVNVVTAVKLIECYIGDNHTPIGTSGACLQSDWTRATFVWYRLPVCWLRTHRHTPTHTHTYTLIEHMWVLTEIYKFSTDGYLTAIVFPLVSSGTRKILIHRVVVLIHRCFHSVLSRHLHPMFAEMITMLSYYCKFLAFLPTIFLPLTSIILLQRYFQKTATSIR